jgi:hypothetical protein
VTNLDDLFTELYDEEMCDEKLIDQNNTNEKMESSRQARVEELVAQKLNMPMESNLQEQAPQEQVPQEQVPQDQVLQNQLPQNLVFQKKKFHKKKKKLILVLAAAMMFILMACAVVQEKEWDILLLNTLGISDADTRQLQGGNVEIGASAANNGITMKAVSSIGDKNTAYVRFDTDYNLPKDYNTNKTSLSFETCNLMISTSKTLEHLSGSGYSSAVIPMNHNGKLSFLLEINCDDINRQTVDITFGDLYDIKYTEDSKIASKELIAKGPWIFHWKFHYASMAKTFHPFQVVKQGDRHILITKIEISPISMKITALKNPFDRRNTSGTNLIGNSVLTFENGKKLSLDSTSSGNSNNFILTSYENLYSLGGVIDPGKIVSLTVGDGKIMFRNRHTVVIMIGSLGILLAVFIYGRKRRER